MIKNIMEKDKEEEEYYQYEINTQRASTMGHQTSHHDRTAYIINEIMAYHDLDLPSFIDTFQKHPHIKDQTKLVEKIFSVKEFREDLIRFLIVPRKMMEKYQLSLEEARDYVATIHQFMHLNYEYCEHHFLCAEENQLNYEIWFEFLDNEVDEVYVTSLGYLLDIFLPLVKYEYSTTSRVTEYFELKYSNQRPILIISHFDDNLIDRILKHTRHETVFKIVFSLVLVSLQEQEWKRSLNLLKLLCLSAIKDEATLDTHIENVYWMVKEVSNNITKDIHNTIFAFVDSIVQTNLVKASLTRFSTIFSFKLNTLESVEDTLEFNSKMLSEVVNIYYLLRKIGIDYTADQMKKLKNNILQIYEQLSNILHSVQNLQSTTLRFSNGQNIKATLMYRFQLLNLIKNLLTVSKEFGDTCPQLKDKVDKALILQYLTRCISENRWNNITHCLIDKIVSLMITPELFKGSKVCVQRFLKFLVETFSNKKYMFLNSANMINQGDIHFLYFISRKITIEIDRTPGIIDSTNQFDFWKQFVLNVLQKYENNNERTSKVSDFESEAYDKIQKDGDFKVEIDEFALIKEIVKKFQINQKWSVRREQHNGGIVRAGSASNLIKKSTYLKAQKSGSPVVHKANVLNIKKSKSFLPEEENASEPEKSSLELKLNISAEQLEILHESSSHSDSQVVLEEEHQKIAEMKL